ncbi:hypothetical protein [Dehalococcoides mccartyi]|uniref:Uncharacterized protein n=1 Tax=Dehalococcoides mccartyi (strain CBDB1) TaxID=255470 RepID=A0A916KM94_DEHMC|nr:hypothetical protein [Dehalococcoides mccartyi]CAI82863.1 hypothetical protein cbdbA700 [Dehalococcoides mccartyi CBDB1]
MNSIQTLNNQRRLIALKQGSPGYTWQPGATAASATAEINVETQFPLAQKYAPLDCIEIINNETANQITVSINGRPTVAAKSWTLPAKTIRIVDDDLGICTVHMTNNGGAITTAGSIIIKLKRKPLTEDMLARMRL